MYSIRKVFQEVFDYLRYFPGISDGTEYMEHSTDCIYPKLLCNLFVSCIHICPGRECLEYHLEGGGGGVLREIDLVIKSVLKKRKMYIVVITSRGVLGCSCFMCRSCRPLTPCPRGRSLVAIRPVFGGGWCSLALCVYPVIDSI